MPRTQTNDTSGGLYSNPLLLFSIANVGELELLFTNHHENSVCVVTTMDLVNTGGAEGDLAAIAVGDPQHVLFGGMRGAGSYDTFSWRGQLGIVTGGSIYTAVVSGQWCASGTGYWVPAWITS